MVLDDKVLINMNAKHISRYRELVVLIIYV